MISGMPSPVTSPSAAARACGGLPRFNAATADQIMAGQLTIAPFPAVTIDPRRDGDVNWHLNPFGNPTWGQDFRSGGWIEELVAGYLAGGPDATAYRARAAVLAAGGWAYARYLRKPAPAPAATSVAWPMQPILEGEVGQWVRLGDGYAGLVAEIRRLVRAAVRQSGGREVDARGDDLFAAFERAPAALQAALAIQRAMHAGAWPGGIDVRLRIGLHRWRPALTDTGYVGLSVHAAA